MEISGSCFSSHLAAAQMEATLTPKLTSQAWSHAGRAGEAAPLSTHRAPGLLRAVGLRPGCSLEAPVQLYRSVPETKV